MDDNETKLMDEVVAEVSGDFEGEIYFSTDGKHTVHAKAGTAKGREAGLLWAFKAYERIVEKLGTKAQMWEKTMNKEADLGKCEKCGAPMKKSFKSGKLYCSDKCWLKE